MVRLGDEIFGEGAVGGKAFVMAEGTVRVDCLDEGPAFGDWLVVHDTAHGSVDNTQAQSDGIYSPYNYSERRAYG